MEENLMERLLNDFNGVLAEFNELVENKDIEGVRKVLAEVNRLIQEQNGIVLDDREPQYDHVLHELLSKMTGVIERVEVTRGIDFEPGARLYTNTQVQEMISEVEKELSVQEEKLKVGKDENNKQMIDEAESERQRLLSELKRLKDALVPNQEYSNLTYIDENLKALQEERSTLIQERKQLEDEIAELESASISVDELEKEGVSREVIQGKSNELVAEELEKILKLVDETGHVSIEDINSTIESLRDEKTRLESGERVVVTKTTEVDSSKIEEIIEHLQQEVELNRNLRNISDRSQVADFSFADELEGYIKDLTEIKEFAISGETENVELSEEEIAEIDRRNAELEEDIKEAQEELKLMATRLEELTAGVTGDLKAQEAELLTHRTELSTQINELKKQLRAVEKRIKERDAQTAKVTKPVLDPMDYTYMGRLNDEQIIRRLLKEQLQLSDEEIDETIGEYSLVQVEDGSHDEYGEDNPISMRQLVRTESEKEPDTEKVTEAVLDPMDYTYMGRLNDEQIIRRLLSEQLQLSDEEINETIGEYSLVQVEDGSHDEYGEDNPISMRQLVRTRTIPVKTLEEEKTELETKIEELKKRKETECTKPIRSINSKLRTAKKNEINRLLEEKEKQLKELKDKFGIDDVSNIQEELENLRKELEDYEIEQEEGDIGDHDNRISALQQRISVLEQVLVLQGEISELTDLQSIFKKSGKKRDLTNRIAQDKAEIKANNLKKEGKNQQSIAEANRAILIKKIQSSIDIIESDLPRVQQGNYTDKINEYNYKLELLRQLQDQIKGLSLVRIQTEQVVEPNQRLEVIDATIKILEEISKEKTKYKVPTTKESEVDKDVIDAKKKRIEEIDARIAEIDNEIAQIPGIHIPGSESRDSLDVTAEAQKIGDKIFKTAKIRRELAEREVTRDEFLAFYKAGYARTIEQQKQLEQDLVQMQEEVKLIIVDKNSDKNYNTQIIEAEKAGNTELLVKLYEQLRQNFIAAGREDQLKEMGIDHEIKTPEDLEKMKQFFGTYKASVNEGHKRIKASIAELKENAQVFQTEIKRIEHEKQTLELVEESPEELEAKSAARKDLRKKLLEASITPEKDLTDEQIELLDSWQEASKRFLDSKSTREYTYIDRDGKEQVLTVDTIAEYEGYKEDIEFLGVPAYKENLEQLSAYEQTQDPYVFGPEVGKAYDEAEAEREGAGAEVLERIMADKKKYIETFNGIPNPHKVKYENWKTAGSTLKGMKPVSRDLPMPTRAKNALENVGRFLGIRVPKFTRLDEHGNEVKDVKGGIATLALDGLVVGAVTASTVAVGPALAVAGYAAKGIVTLGNRIAARIEYSRHKDEIDNNVPVINQADRNAREVARKEYYREQGDNRFVAWAKAKSDKYFTRTRERETEAAIVEGLTTEFNEAEDTRTAALKANLEIARANQDARQSRQRQVAMGANTYNDIVRDPDSVDMEAATAAIARNAALEANRPGTGREDVNADSKAQRRSQYVKAKTPLDKTSDLDEAAFEDATDGPVSAITAEQIYTGRKQHVDRLNKVLTAITAAGLKFGYTAWKDGFTKTDVIHHDAEYREDVVHHDAEYGEVETPVTETRFDTSKTLDELRQNYAGKTAEEYYSVSGGEAGARTEALVDRGITAGWFDDKSQWGTGISDTQGLSAPTLTERLADSNLIGANGMLRQDITVQQLLDAMGCKNPDLSTLDGIYCSVGDKYWVKLSDLMQGMTKDVVVGTTKSTELIRGAWDETVQTLVKDAWDEEIKTFAPELIGKAIKDGALAGAAIGAADVLHEAVQTTYIDGATPGRPEEVTPEAKDSFETIAKKLQQQANKEKQDRERRESEEREDDGAER